MNVIEFFIRRKTFSAMLFLGLSLLGYISYTRLPMETIPNVEFSTLIIQVTCQREVDPEYIEKQAVVALEGAAASLNGVSAIETNVQQQRATITISFDQSVSLNLAYIKLQESVNELVDSIGEEFNVQVVKVDTESLANIFMSLEIRGSGGLERIRSLADKSIIPELEQITGVALVQASGGTPESVEIVLGADAAGGRRRRRVRKPAH